MRPAPWIGVPAGTFSINVRVLAVGVLALLLEIGWLALWPLSVVLSHSPAFTAEVLANHGPAARLLQLTGGIVRLLLPGLTDAPLGEPLGQAVYNTPAIALAGLTLWLAAA